MLAASTWPIFENEIGEPISLVIVTASSAERSCSSAKRRAMTSARSAAVMRGHGPRSKASRAAVTARSISASRPSATRAMTSSLCGEITSIVAVVAG
jgi:hypothetical protein